MILVGMGRSEAAGEVDMGGARTGTQVSPSSHPSGKRLPPNELLRPQGSVREVNTAAVSGDANPAG